MKEINFKCTTCGGNQIEEVLKGVVKFSDITHVGFDKNGELVLQYGVSNDREEGGELAFYQCVDCGAPVSVDVLVELAQTEPEETEEGHGNS
jgi:DNA-directed RNA polymerase subunit RPC12/RpoP